MVPRSLPWATRSRKSSCRRSFRRVLRNRPSLEALEDRFLPSGVNYTHVPASAALNVASQSTPVQHHLSRGRPQVQQQFTSQFGVTTDLVSATAIVGQSFSVTVSAEDANGLVTSNYQGIIQFNVTDPTLFGLPATYQFLPGDAGTHTFTGVTLSTPGQQTIGVSDEFVSALSGSVDVSIINPLPVVTNVAPGSVDEGSPTQTIQVKGSQFEPSSVVQWNGQSLATTFVGPGELDATVAADLLTTISTAIITVTTPAPGGGTSQPVDFTITDAALVGTATSIGPGLNESFDRPVGYFTDDNPLAKAFDFTATVDWGDGTAPTTGILLRNPNGNGFEVDGTHTYTTLGTFDVTVTVSDSGGAAVTIKSAAAVLSKSEAAALSSINITQGTPPPKVTNPTLSSSTNGVFATLFRGQDDESTAFLVVGNYKTLPDVQTNQKVLAVYEVRASAIGARKVEIVFNYPADFKGTPALFYVDPRTQKLEKVNGATDIKNSLVIDAAHHQVIVWIDATSTPPLSDLIGTVFAIVVGESQTTTTDTGNTTSTGGNTTTANTVTGNTANTVTATITPSLAALTGSNTTSGPSSYSTSVELTSSGRLYLALTPSSDSQATLSRTTLSAGTSSGGGEKEEASTDDFFSRWRRSGGDEVFWLFLFLNLSAAEPSEVFPSLGTEQGVVRRSDALDETFLGDVEGLLKVATPVDANLPAQLADAPAPLTEWTPAHDGPSAAVAAAAFAYLAAPSGGARRQRRRGKQKNRIF
jgi:hypothetical protein